MAAHSTRTSSLSSESRTEIPFMSRLETSGLLAVRSGFLARPSVYPVSRCRRWTFALRRAPVRPRITGDPSIFPSQRSSVSEPGQRQARRCVKGRDPANFSRTRTWLRPPVGGRRREATATARRFSVRACRFACRTHAPSRPCPWLTLLLTHDGLPTAGEANGGRRW